MSHHPPPPNLPPISPVLLQSRSPTTKKVVGSAARPTTLLGRAPKFRAPKTTLISCDVTGCRYSTTVLGYHNKHVDRVHNKLVGLRLKRGLSGIPCSEAGCTMAFSYNHTLKAHLLRDHKIENRPLLKCKASDCPFVTRSSTNLSYHHATQQHSIGKGLDLITCDFEGCEYKNATSTFLAVHKAAVHNIGRDNLPPALYCDKAGCTFSASHASKVKFHKFSVHGDTSLQIHCDFLGCQFKALVKCAMATHKAYKHDIDVTWHHCSEDKCEYKAKTSRNLNLHVRRKHRKQDGKSTKD